MGAFTWAVVGGVWFAEAVAVGIVMGRRGFDSYTWTLLGLFLGPLVVPLAARFWLRPPAYDPKLVLRGSGGPGTVDVLVGVDGSPESHAAVRRAAQLFGASARRITLARVIPVDAPDDVELAAETQLQRMVATHPEVDPSAIVLRGKPVAALREYMRQLGYDILVVGTRGAGRNRGVLGSVATALARGAGIPVLLVDDEPAATPAATSLKEAM